jgi:hypothetical protein
MTVLYPTNSRIAHSSLVASLAVASLHNEPISGGCGTFAKTSIRHGAVWIETRATVLEIVRLMSTHLLLDLELINDRRQFRQNLVCLLVVFELGGDELSEVAEGLGCVEDLLIVSVCWSKMESDGVSRTLAHVHSS